MIYYQGEKKKLTILHGNLKPEIKAGLLLVASTSLGAGTWSAASTRVFA